MAWAKNGTPETLGTNQPDLTISDLTANKFNVFLHHKLLTGTQIIGETTFSGNTNTVYANRISQDGAADTTGVSKTNMDLNLNADESFGIVYVCSIAGEEKLLIGFVVADGTAGAANAPKRKEIVGKFVPSPDSNITSINIDTTTYDDFATGSNISALGTD